MRNILRAAAVLTLLAAQASNAGLVSPGDRVVFLGDSITEQRMHTRYVMNYFTLRYPGSKITFRNAGWTGDSAGNGLARLERDVLSLKPDVVTICFGMNDGGVKPIEEATRRRFLDSMNPLVTRLKEAGVRVALLTPGVVDPDQNCPWQPHERIASYNPTLRVLADDVLALARRERIPAFDLHALMMDVQTRAKSVDPAFTMIPDAVHPSAPGQAVMAYAMLKALGCDDQASSLAIDAAAGRVLYAERCRVTGLKVTPGSVRFVRADSALPVVIDEAAEQILTLLPFTRDFNQYTLRVMGLAAGEWILRVQGEQVGAYTAAQLAEGVQLAELPGPWRELGERVNTLSKQQEDLYFTRWRRVSLLDLPNQARPELNALLRKMDRLVDQAEQERLNAPVKQSSWAWELTRAMDR